MSPLRDAPQATASGRFRGISGVLRLPVGWGTVALIATLAVLTPPAVCQKLTRLDREQAQVMLDTVASDIRNFYYDSKLHGVDWDGKVRETKERIVKASTFTDAWAAIAALMEALDDSHTFFIPPWNTLQVEYGWRFQFFGDRCFVTHVRPGSDAEAKGLKPGDEVLTINGFTPERASVWKMEYALNLIAPQQALQVVIRDASGKLRQLDLAAKLHRSRQVLDVWEKTGRDSWLTRISAEDRRHLSRARSEELGSELMVLKLPVVSSETELEGWVVKARKHGTLILDLRGTYGAAESSYLVGRLARADVGTILFEVPGTYGGAESTIRYFVGRLFPADVKIADRVTRAGTTPVVANSNPSKAFTGKLIVLVDSRSASAAELLARVIQLEKRGTVLGDRTSGRTMEGSFHFHQTGLNPVYTYGSQVSVADLIMADGKSLEHVGVTPDEVLLPTAADLASGRDPVLARAAELAGVKLSPEKAGEMFPYEWPPELKY